MTQNPYMDTSFLSRVYKLPEQKKIQLARMLGKDQQTYLKYCSFVFIDIIDPLQHKTGLLHNKLFVISLLCLQQNNGALKIEDYLSSLYNNPTTSQSEKQRIENLFKTDNAYNGDLLHKLIPYVKRGIREGKEFDIYSLYYDLQIWSSHASWRVRKKWAASFNANRSTIQETTAVINQGGEK